MKTKEMLRAKYTSISGKSCFSNPDTETLSPEYTKWLVDMGIPMHFRLRVGKVKNSVETIEERFLEIITEKWLRTRYEESLRRKFTRDTGLECFREKRLFSEEYKSWILSLIRDRVTYDYWSVREKEDELLEILSSDWIDS